jgi:hydrogenase expression/formation protein HypC
MCLGIPGEIVRRHENDRHPNFAEGDVNFGGVVKRVSLAYVPEARVGEYIIVHAGFAIARIDEEEARRVWRYLEEMEELAEIQSETGGAAPQT